MYSKPANYYLPAQRDDETPPLKKEKRCESVSRPPRAARILGRRYALTPTSFKYLEIGISVGIISDVEVIISDNRDTQMILPTATWKTLMKKSSDILRLLDESSPSPLWIQDLTVEVCTISGSKMFKLTNLPKYLFFKPTTMKNLFNLEHCVEHMYAWLMGNTHLVNTKFQNFVNVLREKKKNITELCGTDTEINNTATEICNAAIRESDMFDGDSIIDCELLACALNKIMEEASEK